MGSENDSIIRAAAELIRERAPSEDRPHVSAPPSWHSIGVDIQYPAQLIVRLRPAGDDATDVEVFRWGALVASDHVRRYRSAERLAEQVEDVLKRAVERT